MAEVYDIVFTYNVLGTIKFYYTESYVGRFHKK